MNILRSRRGAALPVALFGLVAVSVLVTTVMLTGSTEYAISSAHRDASSSLFDTDAALEQYLAQRAASGANQWLQATTPSTPQQFTLPSTNRLYNIDVARLAWDSNVGTGGTNLRGFETYSLLARPRDGRGRGVGALVRLERAAAGISTSLNAGATSGGDVSVTGNATISDGSSGTNYCSAANNQAGAAVQVTAGSKITMQGSGALEGKGDTATYTKAEMVDQLLGGVPLLTLANQAGIQFGPRWSKPAFANTTLWSNTGTPLEYNWGCPNVLGASCPSEVPANLSTGRHVVVAIDATNLPGRTVKITGRYGQGILIVLNGSLEIQGNFIFKGIILVEQDVFIRGGAGGQESKIEGGIVSFGASSTVEDNFTGTATIKYNLCAIRDAEGAMNQSALTSAPQTRPRGTFAWYELIR